MQFVQHHRLLVAGAFSILAVVAAAVVLWVRQTPDALLRVDTFAAGLGEVTLWAFPTIVAYLILASRPATLVLAEGFGIGVLLVLGWWSFSTDWHSTASLGPALSGWIVGPALVVGVWIARQFVVTGRAAPRM